MASIPKDKLKRLVGRWETIQAQLSEGCDQETFKKLSKEFSDLDPLVAAIKTLEAAEEERDSLRQMIEDPAAEPDMAELAREELEAAEPRVEQLEHELQIMLLPKDAADEKSAILEVRAGTGGEEAALFAADLFRMYQRYADLKGWKVNVLSVSDADAGGFREIVASISGKGVFARMKFESGVHRVQRVPETENQGRIHTSAATVAVLPEAEEVDVEIREQDIRIDTMRASGAGGQHVNTTDSAVRITHIPTGIIVTSSEKSQHQNRARAMQVLRARLFDMERTRIDEARAAERKDQIGSGDRSQRIRTYNFPQGRVTDHRVNVTLYNLPQIMEGEGLDTIIDALITERQAGQLAAETTVHA
ncbi:peptide chain release factor 1 [Rhodomicrobium vannielii ATCC 17100]|uniref:Peptide chain release factor 1 n=1 Tax=Rhodomicrobium vannielii (strain ATCC 17100 / DSM 162 / LMG 4299 / NCIMB 10020 / ATH 3.1.1) TaxID=648757 RepID=E3I816_RHOVT|nr:peptide chain release factor 1 [Rhodomicrobium vannielii]ADP71942.1 peptide chain release factor 1 [Rhodomicrobium vannielii ATCC 17100]